MKTRRRIRGAIKWGGAVVTVLLLVAMVAGCDTSPLRLPRASEIDRVRVLPEKLGVANCINDEQVKQRFLTFLESLSDGWRKPWGTFPTPQFTVVLEQDRQWFGKVTLWIGPNWIGARKQLEYTAPKRLRALSVQERAELLNLLGLPPN